MASLSTTATSRPPSDSAADTARARRPSRRARGGRALVPWLFLAPAIVLLAVFRFWPTVWGVYLSFFDVRPYLGNQWIGFANFSKAFGDPALISAVWHTVFDALASVVGSAFLGFCLALLLEGPARHLRLLRTAAFLPVVIAMVAAAELWNELLYPGGTGAVNTLLGDFGVGPQQFLSSPHEALASVIGVQIWKAAPYDMVIFVAGLAGVDRELYEAVAIDGAKAWQRLRYVTLPALRPITTIVLVLGIIRGLRVFTDIWVSTNGGPAGSTESIVTFLYRQFSQNNDTGYAAALGTVLLVVTMALTCLMLLWRRRGET